MYLYKGKGEVNLLGLTPITNNVIESYKSVNSLKFHLFYDGGFSITRQIVNTFLDDESMNYPSASSYEEKIGWTKNNTLAQQMVGVNLYTTMEYPNTFHLFTKNKHLIITEVENRGSHTNGNSCT